ncbi:MAG TPA: protein kinase [Aggregatilineales bacterium]|nr:protein kinase [Aggregatilineales bacterium]
MVDVLGTKLGRYEVRERLGIGGMATVYKGWDTNLDRWVAVKVLHDHLVEQAGFKERFEREAKVVASLSHPNIVQVFDFDTVTVNTVPVYYMVMAYIPGKSLKNLMDDAHRQNERLPLSQVSNVMRGVLSALDYAHKQGMVHRDVTPANILFNEQGQAVLTDFGIAKIVSGTRLTQSGMTVGTPMYMPPEQGTGDTADSRSDIYSMGVILFEMLSGEAPYQGDSAVALILKHINDPIPSVRATNADLTPAMDSVVMRALAKDPADRYATAADFLADFETAMGGGAVTAVQDRGRTVFLPTGATRSTRLPWMAIATGLGVIVVVLAIAVLSRSSGNVPAASGPDATVTLSVVEATSGTETSGAASMTSGPLFFNDDFGPIRGDKIWPITTDDPTIYRNIENGAYHIRLTRPATALATEFDPDHEYGDHVRYDADVTISDKSQPDSGAGFVFRYQDSKHYYVFGVNGQGAVSLWLYNDAQWTELRHLAVKWTPLDAAKGAGQSNHLRLYDLGTRVVALVNGQVAIDLQINPVIMSGAIGFYTATTSSTKVPDPLAEVFIKNYSVSAIDPQAPLDLPGTPSAQATPAPTVAASS